VFISGTEPLTEDSPRDWQTKNPYAKAKMMADRDVVETARNRGIFACSAILFNHESIRRTKSVTAKIIRTLIDIKQGRMECLMIGNVDMCRDWGFAGDYVQAIHLMLQQSNPEDMVLATGELHSVRECIDLVCAQLSLRLTWQGEGVEACACDSEGVVRVKVSPEFYKPAEVHQKLGNTSKAQRVLGWKSATSFRQLIIDMVDSIVH
jgi:GDPmannose 4,6-dehydratase